MKLKDLFSIIVLLFLFIPLSLAQQEQKVDVNIEIITYEIKDAKVVGDFFIIK